MARMVASRTAALDGGNPGRRRAARNPLRPRPPMRCLLSGELVEPMPTQNKIERLSDVGGLAMGDSLVSFDKDAFTSYGLEQGQNAAMSEVMVKTYSTALNHLIRKQSKKLAGVKVVYWYSHHARREERSDGGSSSADQGPQAQSEEDGRIKDDLAAGSGDGAGHMPIAGRLLDAIRSGERPELADYRYYALTIVGQ